MDVGVVWRDQELPSLTTYRDEVLARFPDWHKVHPEATAVHADLLWDPGMGLRGLPPVLQRTKSVPRVATMHGLALTGVKPWEGARSWTEVPLNLELARRAITSWRRHPPAWAIAPSQPAAKEATRWLGVSRVEVIPHGVDHATFHGGLDPMDHPRPYLLHVSHAQGVKNIHRIVQAYRGMRMAGKPDLVLVCQRCPIEPGNGIQVVANASAQELASWYRGALGLVAPSLSESFGMPVLEAMACGTPSIVGAGTGAAEVAGDAGLAVVPRSVDAIRSAMEAVVRGEGPSKARCLERAKAFTWDESVEAHIRLFRRAYDEPTA